MQRVNFKIRRKQKMLLRQCNTLCPLFRGNGGTWDTKLRITAKICIPVCSPFLKMCPLLYLRNMRSAACFTQLYPMFPHLYSREGVQL